MANEETAEKAKEMYESGMSMSEIANELNVSKTTVHRMLHMTLGASTNHYGTMDTKGNLAYHKIENPVQGMDGDLEFRLRQLELDHERKMYELRNRTLELEIKKGESASREDKKHKEVTRQGKVYLNRYLRLLKELRKNCEETDWEEDYLEEFKDKMAELRDEMEDFIAMNTDHAPEEFTIWERLNDFVNEFEEYWEEADDTYTIDYDSDELEHLDECLEQDDFFDMESEEEMDEDD